MAQLSKRNKKDVNNLSLMEHFVELRIRIIFALLVLLGTFFLLFANSREIINFVTGPIKLLGYNLHFIKIHEAFYSTLKASFAAALIFSSPLWVWILLGFVLPALEKKQKTGIILLLLSSFLFVISGFIFSYKILLPFSMRFLLNFRKSEFISIISIEYYLAFFLRLFISTGLGFQMPLLMLFLNKIGFADYKTLLGFRKYALVSILLLSAVITPPDVVSQIILGLPLYLLFELGILLTYIFRKRGNSPVGEIHG